MSNVKFYAARYLFNLELIISSIYLRESTDFFVTVDCQKYFPSPFKDDRAVLSIITLTLQYYIIL